MERADVVVEFLFNLDYPQVLLSKTNLLCNLFTRIAIGRMMGTAAFIVPGEET